MPSHPDPVSFESTNQSLGVVHRTSVKSLYLMAFSFSQRFAFDKVVFVCLRLVGLIGLCSEGEDKVFMIGSLNIARLFADEGECACS